MDLFNHILDEFSIYSFQSINVLFVQDFNIYEATSNQVIKFHQDNCSCLHHHHKSSTTMLSLKEEFNQQL